MPQLKNHRRIGIQFNFDKDRKLSQWPKNYPNLKLSATTHHLDIHFRPEDWKIKPGQVDDSEVFQCIMDVLDEFVEYSHYFTCYSYIADPELGAVLPEISDHFQEKPVFILEPDPTRNHFIEDFDFLNEHRKIKSLLEANPLYLYLDAVRRHSFNRWPEIKKLNLCTAVEYNEKDDFGQEFDHLRIDVQFENE